MTSQRDPDLRTPPPVTENNDNLEVLRRDCLAMAQDHHRPVGSMVKATPETILETAKKFMNFVKGTA